MAQAAKAASFQDFLRASSRLAKPVGKNQTASDDNDLSTKQAEGPSSKASKQTKPSTQKQKVGLTIDSDILDAVDDYIYHARKQGRRLKKNDVYEAALRQFLGLEGDEPR